jgi:hypothetical protein
VILFELEESPVRSILRNRSSSHREFLLALIHPASGRFIQYVRYKFEKNFTGVGRQLTSKAGASMLRPGDRLRSASRQWATSGGAGQRWRGGINRATFALGCGSASVGCPRKWGSRRSTQVGRTRVEAAALVGGGVKWQRRAAWRWRKLFERKWWARGGKFRVAVRNVIFVGYTRYIHRLTDKCMGLCSSVETIL